MRRKGTRWVHSVDGVWSYFKEDMSWSYQAIVNLSCQKGIVEVKLCVCACLHMLCTITKIWLLEGQNWNRINGKKLIFINYKNVIDFTWT